MHIKLKILWLIFRFYFFAFSKHEKITLVNNTFCFASIHVSKIFQSTKKRPCDFFEIFAHSKRFICEVAIFLHPHKRKRLFVSGFSSWDSFRYSSWYILGSPRIYLENLSEILWAIISWCFQRIIHKFLWNFHKAFHQKFRHGLFEKKNFQGIIRKWYSGIVFRNSTRDSFIIFSKIFIEYLGFFTSGTSGNSSDGFQKTNSEIL